MLLLVICLYPLDGMGHRQRVKARPFLMKLLMMIRRVAVISRNPCQGDMMTYSIAPFPVFIRVVAL